MYLSVKLYAYNLTLNKPLLPTGIFKAFCVVTYAIETLQEFLRMFRGSCVPPKHSLYYPLYVYLLTSRNHDDDATYPYLVHFWHWATLTVKEQTHEVVVNNVPTYTDSQFDAVRCCCCLHCAAKVSSKYQLFTYLVRVVFISTPPCLATAQSIKRKNTNGLKSGLYTILRLVLKLDLVFVILSHLAHKLEFMSMAVHTMPPISLLCEDFVKSMLRSVDDNSCPANPAETSATMHLNGDIEMNGVVEGSDSEDDNNCQGDRNTATESKNATKRKDILMKTEELRKQNKQLNVTAEKEEESRLRLIAQQTFEFDF
ncbi:hypothetical protein GQX74_001352 [Glossina fuscipes]|nr:hypothetical protein GQX74_001352 [Glossina fuscipes]